jgi:sulfate adenylyltransferase subunit 1 (EFTu-like GTPase family)
VVLHPHPGMTKEYITFVDNGKARVILVDTVKVSESVTCRHVALVKSLGFNHLLVS